MSDDNFSVPQQRRIAMIDELSRVAYTVSRAYMVRNGDPSLRPWEEMDYLDQEYVRQGVEIYLSHPDAGAEIWHEMWLDDVKKAGWSRGKAYDPVKKKSPVFLPFEQLPSNKRNGDLIFHATVRALTITESGALQS